MTIVFDGGYQILKVADMGPYGNNAYVIVDPASKEAYLIDAPAQIHLLLDEALDFRIKGVIITHTHPDHVAGYKDLKRLTDLPVAVHEADAGKLPGKPEQLLVAGEDLRVGRTRIRILHTPGHTPGGLCLYLEGSLISGDTLFPGGPGRTGSAVDFKQVVHSITTQLHSLPESTLVLPGHGVNTTIGDSRREYAVFASRSHPDNLHDNVTWLES